MASDQRFAVRTIPDQFLGALLGAWLGVSTEIWTKPADKVTPFVISLVLIAILLAIVSQPYHWFFRLVVATVLILLTLLIVETFTFNPSLAVFEDTYSFSKESKILFFRLIVFSWVGVGLISSLLENFLSWFLPLIFRTKKNSIRG